MSVLLLKSFLKSQYTSYYFYEQHVARTDAQDILTTLYLVGQATESRINTGFSISFPDSTGVSQGCQSTIPIRKKSLQKQRKDLAL